MSVDVDPRRRLALAEKVLAAAEKAGATEAEVLVLANDSALTRFANSEIHQNVAETSATVNLRFVLGRRVGVATTGRTDDDGLVALVEQAGSIARVVEELEDWSGLPEPGAIPDVEGIWSEATASASPESRAEGVRAVIAAADTAGSVAYGSFSTGAETIAVANSKGIRAVQRQTSAQLLTVSMAPNGGTGYAEAVSVDVGRIDAAAIGREAAEKAHATQNPVAIDAGEWPVVLEEYAVVDVLDMLGYLGFSALAVQEERSFYEPGRRIGSDLVTIVDDPFDQDGLPMAFDAGRCVDVVYDAQTAARAGRRSTGHGLPAPNPYGPFPLNMVMSAGMSSREELIGGLDRGLLVTRFHYTNPVHPKLCVITGMTRDGTFLVEGGKIVGPVRNLRYTMSYLDALAGVSAVGSERKTLKGFLGGVVVPAVRIDGWSFTGTTEH